MKLPPIRIYAEVAITNFLLIKMKLELLGLIFGLVSLETLGQFLARKYYDNKEKLWMFIICVFCYITIAYVLVKTYELENVGFVNALWSGITLIAVSMLGYFVFDESFTTQEYFAIGLIFSGTILLGIQK